MTLSGLSSKDSGLSGKNFSSLKCDFPLLRQASSVMQTSSNSSYGSDGKLSNSKPSDGKPVKPVVYLDSAASSQKPQSVLDAMDEFYTTYNSNVHRGAYRLATLATDAVETGRQSVARFINATSASEIVFTKNATESINLVARSWAGANLGAGDAVLITEMEHHANIVPWQIMAAEKGFELRWIPVLETGYLDLQDLDTLLDGVKLLAVTAASNVLGTINPVRYLADKAHNAGALILVDAAQMVPNSPTDVQSLDLDFLCFTGHKMCGPTGVGVLWGRSALLDDMPPMFGGGNMILDVRRDGFLANEVPHKFEAGTLPIAEIVGLNAAIEYLEKLGMNKVRAHELALTDYALNSLKSRFGDSIVIHGPDDPQHRIGVFSIAYQDVHPHDVAQVLDEYGVCVRAGHHCAKPLMRALCASSTVRASIYVYNDMSDIDVLSDALASAGEMFSLSL